MKKIQQWTYHWYNNADYRIQNQVRVLARRLGLYPRLVKFLNKGCYYDRHGFD